MAWKQFVSPFPYLLPDVKTGTHQSDFSLSLQVNRSRYKGPGPKPVVVKGALGVGSILLHLVWETGLPEPF